MGPNNLFHNIPEVLPEELLTSLCETNGLRIERIVSQGQASPPGFWYDQADHEWVVLLQGNATLLFEGESAPLELRPGDYVNIPAHCRHRIEKTDRHEITIWLAIHYRAVEE